jgi:hypothetical protein
VQARTVPTLWFLPDGAKRQEQPISSQLSVTQTTISLKGGGWAEQVLFPLTNVILLALSMVWFIPISRGFYKACFGADADSALQVSSLSPTRSERCVNPPRMRVPDGGAGSGS